LLYDGVLCNWIHIHVCSHLPRAMCVILAPVLQFNDLFLICNRY
jgi:hypothetical protein